jgi:Mg2+/citrate symporter
MTWLTALIAVALVVALVATTGIKPRGTRHVAGTGLMTAARVVLVIMIIISLYFVLRARSGG